MRAKIVFEVPEERTIDYNYNHALGSAIYSLFQKADPDLATEVHYGRGFKFFTFSNLHFRHYRATKNGLNVKGEGWFILASPRNDIMEAIVTGTLLEGGIHLWKCRLIVKSIEVLETPEISSVVRMKTLSPIIVTTKKDTPEGSKTWDLMPSEPGFYANVRKNLQRKYREFYGREAGEFDIVDITRVKTKRIKIKSGYNETYHRAVHMHFKARGSREMILFALDAGLGEKNSMGFGCIDILNKR